MNAKRDTIAMPIETTARELLPKLFLAIKLAEEGFVCYLGLKSMIREVALRSGDAIFMDKGYQRGNSDPLFKKLRQAGCLIVELDEENGVDFQDFHTLNTRMPDHLFSLVDHVLVWGHAQYEHLRTNRPSFDSERVSVTGHPRFDLLKPPSRKLYADKVNLLKQEHGPFILFAANAKYYNNIGGREFVIQQYESRVKGLSQRIADEERRMRLNISLIRRLALEAPYKIIVRPHPAENLSTYREAFADLPQVHAIYDDTPIYWILAADLVIHNYSTIGLESAMLEKLAISYSPFEVEEGFVPWIPIACSITMNAEDQVVDFVQGNRADWPGVPDVSKTLGDYFNYDRCAAKLVVDAIKRLAQTTPANGARGSLKGYLTKLKMLGFLQSIKGGASMGDIGRNKLNDLNPPVVKKRFAELRAQAGASDSVDLKVMHPLLYRISPR